MRIAYVINSLEGGGAQFPVPAVTGIFRDAGHEVAVFALARKDGRAEAPIKAAGLEVFTCEAGLHDHIGAWRWLERALRDWEATHLWTSLSRATLLGQQAGRRLRLPVASWQHSAWLKPANRMLLRASRHLSAFWIADSQFVREKTQAALKIPADRFEIWPIFQARTDAPSARQWQIGETVRIGSVGRLTEAKGYRDLIAALSLLEQRSDLPPWEMVIAGEGPLRHVLEQQISKAAVKHISMPGFDTDPPGFLARQHLYVQSSRWEGFCVAAHEAMQAGLPLVGTEVGEMGRSLKDSKGGWLSPAASPRDLAEALAEALKAPERLYETGRRNRNFVYERFSQDAFREQGLRLVCRLEQSRPN
ncbi:glycosyltransferase [Acetobacter sp. AN02]|uniref:glycosyltransferase n=1 Tax=Acetobacter sp. AN02 TaxID=2894186 RepID=UPI00243459AC|nr:glycosyltransferase [Acetobacter sp. AN02]MDG6094157.1 glycosyltransferase [Acetobacter sp. AN02]